jgi:metal-responsive CopG/Arc/MetJ family transcriptional regulator
MPALAIGNTVYTRPVAKVMISLPDELLARIDAHAAAAGETRSGFLQRLAERDLDAAEQQRRDEVRSLLDLATSPMGGDAVRMIREDRESH